MICAWMPSPLRIISLLNLNSVFVLSRDLFKLISTVLGISIVFCKGELVK